MGGLLGALKFNFLIALGHFDDAFYNEADWAIWVLIVF